MELVAERPKTNPKVDAAAREKLITARIGLLLRSPFYGNLATRLELVNADDWCSTAATDGRRFYYNSEFINKMPLKQCEFLCGHEVLHIVYDHFGRRGDRQPRIWNIANDYCVNSDLIDTGVGEKITVVSMLYDHKYKGKSSEEIYDELMQNADKINVDQLGQMLLDEHMDSDDESDGDGKEGDKGSRPRLSAEERKQIRDEIKEAVINAAQSAGAGNIPQGVQRLIKDLVAPQISWRELIEQQIQSVIKNDFTFSRPGRKSWHMDAILPGMKNGDMIDLCIGFDMSGSIGVDDSRVFLSEVKGIMEAYDEYNIRVWCFDTEIYNDQTFNSDNLDSIDEYVPQGGGGTDFEANWRYMKENGIEPKKFIMFTDGYPCGGWGDENYCDTVWIIKGNEQAKPPFGISAIYEHAARKSK